MRCSLAVGNHLLVGGDNMDLALAHHVEQFAEQGVKQPLAIRLALAFVSKRQRPLLSSGGPETQNISVLAAARLVGGNDLGRGQPPGRQGAVGRRFPLLFRRRSPARRRASGFREIGLPFRNRHRRHPAPGGLSAGSRFCGQPVQPTRILFNGGVFSRMPCKRLLDVVGSWFGGVCPKTLAGIRTWTSPLPGSGPLRLGQAEGRRADSRHGPQLLCRDRDLGSAIPSAAPMKALCVVPMGMEEGTEADVPGDEIGLVVGESPRGSAFSSSTRRQDRPGDLLDAWDEQEIEETDSMETSTGGVQTDEDCVPSGSRRASRNWACWNSGAWALRPPGGWKLEFSVREDAET